MPKPHKYHPRKRQTDDGGDADTQHDQGPRPTWSGNLSFGLVTIPVELYSAMRPPPLRSHTVTEEGVRLARKYYCEKDDRDLESDELVRGFELPDGKYVLVEDAELEALAPKKSREIDLQLFTDLGNLHPGLFENPYVLAPARDNTAGKAYRLLVDVMHRQKRAGIATFVLREREYIITIVSDGRLLLGETLRFADEIRSAEDVDLPTPKKAKPALVSKFARALEAKSKGRFDATTLIDPGHEALAKLLEAKRKKGEVLQPPETNVDTDASEAAADGGEVVDLMRLLKQSLQQPTKSSSAAAGKKRRSAG